jgi:glycosyltransferase involved in cell wall biosynthesis
MRILMLGWEFPPFIAGGLGVACYGLTKALDRLGHEVLFILPRPVDRSQASHIKLLAPGGRAGPRPRRRSRRASAFPPPLAAHDGAAAEAAEGAAVEDEGWYGTPGFDHAAFHDIPAVFRSPYGDSTQPVGAASGQAGEALGGAGFATGADTPELEDPAAAPVGPPPQGAPRAGGGHHYSGDLFGDAERYARLVVALARHERFDIIHAHDWLTFPAGIALSKVTRKPLVVHVHSTEFDRSGEHVNQAVYDIERRGMHAADRVIAVSAMTRSICERRYAVPAGKTDVVYNGIDPDDGNGQHPPLAAIGSRDKIVLFIGRITMQKGPEYFIAAARRVLERYPDVKFVMAGSGDMANRMIELAAQIGIGHKVLFTGFLRGKDVERVYQMADCYVMPSVSEPFGIVALEALHHDVPVIISKQSGVSEVLTHVLKVDFWDVDDMANKILAVLRHPPLAATLRHHGEFELHRLTWTGAAERCLKTYEKLLRPAMASAR